MSDRDAESAGYDRYSEKKGLSHAVQTMPRWKKTMLVLSLVVGVAGLGVQAASSLLRKTAPITPTAATHVAPGATTSGTPGSSFVGQGGNGFVGGQAVPPGDAGSVSSPPAEGESISEKSTPYVTRIGFSVFVGGVVGFIFRTFIKMAAGITAMFLAGVLALSYFHVFNIDMTSVKSQTATASAWVSDQAHRAKDMLFNALPSSTAAGAGFFFGFKRR